MSNVATGTATAPLGLLSRFVGIITAPQATFEHVVAHPRWLGMLLLTFGISIVCAAGPLFTEWGRQAMLDQQVQVIESFGATVTDEAYAQMQGRAVYAPYTTAVSIAIFGTLMLLLVSGIFYAVFNAMLGGNATFKQQFAVLVHAGVITTLGQLFALPLNYARGSMSSATNLAVLLPMLDETSFLARFLGMIDLFMVWYVVVLAIGLAVLYRRRTQPIAWSLFAVYGVIAIGVALVRGMLGGSN